MCNVQQIIDTCLPEVDGVFVMGSVPLFDSRNMRVCARYNCCTSAMFKKCIEKGSKIWFQKKLVSKKRWVSKKVGFAKNGWKVAFITRWCSPQKKRWRSMKKGGVQKNGGSKKKKRFEKNGGVREKKGGVREKKRCSRKMVAFGKKQVAKKSSSKKK